MRLLIGPLVIFRSNDGDIGPGRLMDTAQHYAIYAAANQEHPEKVAAGEAVDRVCRDLAKEVRASTERPEPTEAEPSAEPSPG